MLCLNPSCDVGRVMRAKLDAAADRGGPAPNANDSLTSVQKGRVNDGYSFTDADPETVLVIRSVLPVFTREDERPERLGTCVLARIDGYPFIVTAAHVLHDIQRIAGRFTVAVGGHLFGLESDQFGTRQDDRADVGLIPMPSEAAAIFVEHGGRFLDDQMIDESEKADGQDILNMLANTYLVVGFSASKSQTRIHHGAKEIRAKAFAARLTLAPTNEYPEGLSSDHHMLLDFPTDEILLSGRSINPPGVKGLSGGGVFRFHRRKPETTKLVGILIEHDKAARVMVGTRMAVVSALARKVIARNPEAFLAVRRPSV